MTSDQLKRRGSLTHYCLCERKEESTNHLLIHSGKARSLWALFSFGVSWVLAGTTKEILLSKHGTFVGEKRGKAWRTTPFCLSWTIWQDFWSVGVVGSVPYSLSRFNHVCLVLLVHRCQPLILAWFNRLVGDSLGYVWFLEITKERKKMLRKKYFFMFDVTLANKKERQI